MLAWIFLFSQILQISIIPSVSTASNQHIMSRETNSCQERGTPGYICETCELLAICVKSNGWMNIPVETCDTQKGFYCNANMGGCSNETGPCHPFGTEGNFPCTSKGIFPDPYDCQKYHMCYFVGSTLVAATVDCGGDKAFNAATGECSLSFQDPICYRQQFQCERAGDAMPWPNNRNIFYICQAATNQDIRVLYPTLYRCNAGEIFDGLVCKPEDNSLAVGTTMDPGTNITTTTTVKPITTTTDISNEKQPIISRKCKKIGLQADPNDCRSYYYCSGLNGTLKHTKCPIGTHYNAELSSCSFGSC